MNPLFPAVQVGLLQEWSFHKRYESSLNGEVSDGGGHQTPESANACRPPPFARP
jgi:hypothetical protein